MSLHELIEQVVRLSKSDRLALVSTIIESLQEDNQVSKSDAGYGGRSHRTRAIQRMRGLLKTDQSAPTDEEVAVMLEEHKVKKYL